MGQVTEESFCTNGHRLDEWPSLPVADRKPWPECGSLGRHFKVALEDTAIDLHESLAVTAKPAGGGKAFMKQKVGDSFSYAAQKWMHVQQVVDRRGNRYVKEGRGPGRGRSSARR